MLGQVILFDPSIGTRNLGDFIIRESVLRWLEPLSEDGSLVSHPTRTPLASAYQLFNELTGRRSVFAADLKFIGGTNVLTHALWHPGRNLRTGPLSSRMYRGAVTVGVGTGGTRQSADWYTKGMYRRTLSREYVHSVRDEAARELLESAGLRASVTGCATMWALTDEHCSAIPTAKGDNVVFTLTDYAPDRLADQLLLDSLTERYGCVTFFPQGARDLEYFRSLERRDRVRLLPRSLEAFRFALTEGNVDYVGTRLHGGIFAMQHGVRSIILVVDGRAREMARSFNINSVERSDLQSLRSKIENPFPTRVGVDSRAVGDWMGQFARAERPGLIDHSA